MFHCWCSRWTVFCWCCQTTVVCCMCLRQYQSISDFHRLVVDVVLAHPCIIILVGSVTSCLLLVIRVMMMITLMVTTTTMIIIIVIICLMSNGRQTEDRLIPFSKNCIFRICVGPVVNFCKKRFISANWHSLQALTGWWCWRSTMSSNSFDQY